MAASRVRVVWTSPITEASQAIGRIDVEIATLARGELTGRDEFAFARAGFPILNSTPEAVRKTLLAIGTPEVEGAQTARDTAIGLLQLAAEIEHALMVQYLYAAASIAGEEDSDSVNRNILQNVAVQEMGHLIAVQNLILAIGGPKDFHFARDNIRVSAPGNPIPLVLEPISLTSIAKYVVAEMPAEITDQALKARVDKLITLATQVTGITPNRVGALYAKLFWLFQCDDSPVAPLNLKPDPQLGLFPGNHISAADYVDDNTLASYQANRDEWVRGSVSNFLLADVKDSRSALDLIASISAQGEGLLPAEQSHFFEFMRLLDQFEKNAVKVHPLPVNPTARNPAPPDALIHQPILTPYGKAWAEIFDIRYNFLCLDMWHAMSTPRGETARSSLIRLAFDNMHLLAKISDHLLKLRDDLNVADIAPTFGLILDSFPVQPARRWEEHRRLLVRQTGAFHAVKDSPEFQICVGEGCTPIDFRGLNILETIEQSDVLREVLCAA